MDQHRAKVYLALLTGQPITGLTGRGKLPAADRADADPSGSGDGPGTPARGPIGSVNLTMPLATWLGLSDAPGQAAGYGPLDADDSRDVAALLARQSGSRWCITLTGEGGRPMAHGCARVGPGPSGGSRPPPLDSALPAPTPHGSGRRCPGPGPRPMAPGPHRSTAHYPGPPPMAPGRPGQRPVAPSPCRSMEHYPRLPLPWSCRPASGTGLPASPSAGWRRATAAIGGSRPPTGRRPACGT
jgi:hypothetical protein